MHHGRLILRLIVLGVLLSLIPSGLGGGRTVSAQARRVPSTPQPGPTGAAYVPGRLIVKLRPPDENHPDASPQALADVEQDLSSVPGLQVLDRHPLIPFTLQHGQSGGIQQELYQVFEVSPEADIEQLAERLMKNPRVEYATPDHLMHIDDTPNDPLFTNQWAFNDSATAKMRFPWAWAYTKGSSDVVIAVLDTGLDITHPDINGKNTGAGKDFYYNDLGIQDGQGHGTNVAGIAAASSNNGTGVAGACWNCKVLPIKVCNDDPSALCPESATQNGIFWAVDHGADVINMSLGGSTSGFGALNWQSAIDYAYNNGVVVVASAGNYNESLDTQYSFYPAQANHVMAVGAVDSADHRCDDVYCGWWWSMAGSGHGSKLSVMAPGELSLVSTDLVGSGGWDPGNYSSNFGGTSGAAPFVSGLAGLIKSVNPDLTVDQIRALIEQHADPIGTPVPNNYYGWGRINAYWSVFYALPVDNAAFISESGFPTVAPGQSFQIYFTMRNTGNTTWHVGSYWLQNQQNALGAAARQDLAQDIPSNQTYTFYINVTAPTSPGTYRSAWQLDHNGTLFGPYFYIDVTVPQPGSAPTTPSNPNPPDWQSIKQANFVPLTWSTSGTSCDFSITGGILNTNMQSIGCFEVDFNGHYPGTYQWHVTAHNAYGQTGGPTWHFVIRPTRSDFDNDFRSDPAKYDPNSRVASWLKSSTGTWGSVSMGNGTFNYVPRSDFDGDGKTDPAKFVTSANALWYYKSSASIWEGIYMGPGTYQNVPSSDFDGDGKTDPALFLPSANALWYRASSTGTWQGVYMGPGSYQVIPGSDFDGDGKTDPAIFVSAGGANALWYRRSTTGVWTGLYMGPGSYQIVPGSDFDGDGKTDPALYYAASNSLWYFKSGSSAWQGVYMGSGTFNYVGASDFDGDGKTDPAQFTPSTGTLWWLKSTTGSWDGTYMGAGSYSIIN